MISKYAVYENVGKVICKDGKERYVILCPGDETNSHCAQVCPFYEHNNMAYECDEKYTCHLIRIKHDDNLCETFDKVREIIEEAYGNDQW